MQYLDLKCIEEIHSIMDNEHMTVKTAIIQTDYVLYSPDNRVYGSKSRGFPLYLYRIATEHKFDIDMAVKHLDFMRTVKEIGGKSEFLDARRHFRYIMKIYNVELTEEVELWMRLTW